MFHRNVTIILPSTINVNILLLIIGYLLRAASHYLRSMADFETFLGKRKLHATAVRVESWEQLGWRMDGYEVRA